MNISSTFNMNSPVYSYPRVSSAIPSPISSNLLFERIKLYMKYIDEASERDLYNFFVDVINEIFGCGAAKGWEIDKLKTTTSDEQKYICREPDSVYHFLCSNGYIFRLCYKLLNNSLLKFHLPFCNIPNEVRKKIEKSFSRSYYGLRFVFHEDSNIPIGLSLNSFEYYMFNFALYGLKLTSDDNSNFITDPSKTSVYRLLCLDYLKYFLPLDSSAFMVMPLLQLNVLSTIENQKQYTSTSKTLNFIKKEVACKDMSNDKIESSSWALTSEATWRSELVAFFFADLWLSYNVSALPSIELTKLIRCFIKHIHLYSNRAKYQPADNLKLILIPRHGSTIYQYLAYYMDNWPQDFSFRLLLENWLSYIQPWRYEDLVTQQYSISEIEMNEKWKVFIIRNLLCYTKLFHLVIKRFICIDICSPRHSIMVFRTLKVFTHPYLVKLILDVEHMLINNELHNKKWISLINECLAENEGPSFKYESMFSKERNNEYKLFYCKLQKSLDYAAVELFRFQVDKTDRTNASMLELILSPRKNKMSDYTIQEWQDIQTNIKSSLLFMEQIINVNMSVNLMPDNISSWSISCLSGNNSINSLFNSTQSFIQSYEQKSSNLSSRSVFHTKEWEVDPDYLEPLSYENEILVKLSKYLRNIVELYWNSYILEYSTNNTIIAGVLRQTLLRPPMKIFSYEPRNDGSGKKVRTPKVVQPTISFRWIASYFTITWILTLLAFIMVYNKTIIWIVIFSIFIFIFLSLKYLLGYAPPFIWDNN